MFTVRLRKGESREQQRAVDRFTQLRRTLREVGIGSILAYSLQAKGRVERSSLTAQIAVKQLRLAKMSTIEAANAFLENEYWPEWNECFVRPVFANQHRALTDAQDLTAISSLAQDRVIAYNYTFSFRSALPDPAQTNAIRDTAREPVRGTAARGQIEGSL